MTKPYTPETEATLARLRTYCGDALAAQVVAPKKSDPKSWPENQPTGKCWSCDAPNSPRHDCDFGHYVFACEEQCRIVDRERSAIPGRGMSMAFEDCPDCQAEVAEAMEKHDRDMRHL